jgi:hypothetical protein
MLEYAQIFPYLTDMMLMGQTRRIDIWKHEKP